MLTPVIAATASLAIVLAATLALLTLEYRGPDVVRWLGGTFRRSATRASEPALDAHDASKDSEERARSASPHSTLAIETLRILTGVVWLFNLLFIVVPSANYWSTFTSVAESYGSSTLGGPGVANFVAANSVLFAWLIALATAYLAVALILGVTTRLACMVGVAVSIGFFLTQFGTTFAFPGGTDVGAHPLYIVIYVALWIGGAGRTLSVDALLWKRGRGRRTSSARWFMPPAGRRISDADRFDRGSPPAPATESTGRA